MHQVPFVLIQTPSMETYKEINSLPIKSPRIMGDEWWQLTRAEVKSEEESKSGLWRATSQQRGWWWVFRSLFLGKESAVVSAWPPHRVSSDYCCCVSRYHEFEWIKMRVNLWNVKLWMNEEVRRKNSLSIRKICKLSLSFCFTSNPTELGGML